MALKAGPKSQIVTALPHPEMGDVEWFELVTGRTLYTWQREELGAAMMVGRARRRYVQVARKNGKSAMAAAAGICQARRRDSHIYCVSDSQRSVNGALMRELRSLIDASPVLSASFVQFKTHIEIPSTGSFIEGLPNKFAASQSINPHMVLFDEVHLQQTDDFWQGMVNASIAHVDDIVLGITSPGQDVTAPAHGFYEAVKAGAMPGRVFEAPDGSTAYTDRAQWVVANPRCVDDPAFVERLEGSFESVTENHFRRYNLGLWTAGGDAWLPYGLWPSLLVPRRDLAGVPVWLGFDGSYSEDSTAIIAATRDGYIHVVGVWENPGRKGWRVPRQEVCDVVLETFADLDVQAMYMDKPYWERELAEWDALFPGRVIEFPTNSRARMAPACQTFRVAALEGRLSHAGDPRLQRHLDNAVVKPSPVGDYITKADKNSPRKIDMAVASVLAVHGALLAPEPRGEIWAL